MYGSFRDLIKPTETMPIPQQMIDYFNTTVPDAFEYLQDDTHETTCFLSAKDDKEILISGFAAKLTERQKNMLGEEAETPAAIGKLLNNALEEIEIDNTNAILQLDDTRKPFGCLMRTVNDNQYAAKGTTYIKREPLEFELPLVCGNVRAKIPFVQQSSGAIDIIEFASRSSALEMLMRINATTGMIRYNINFNNKNEPDARRCLDLAIILDGLRTSETEIEGFGRINLKPDVDEHRLAPFWQRVVEVESALNVSFHANTAIDKGTYANINRLHRCICEGNAVGLGFKPDSISLITVSDLKYSSEKPCRLLFPQKNDLTIFGELYTVFANIGLSGIILGKPSDTDGTCFKIPISYTDDYQCSILYFATEDKVCADAANAAQISDILFAPLPDGKRF